MVWGTPALHNTQLCVSSSLPFVPREVARVVAVSTTFRATGLPRGDWEAAVGTRGHRAQRGNAGEDLCGAW